MQLSATDTLAIAAEDGKNTVRLALDNEHEDFLYSASQAEPIAPSGGATSQARLYDGPTAVSASSVAWAVDFSKSSGVPTSGTNAPTVSAAGLLTVKHITAAAKVVVKATYPKTNGQDYYAEFTANKTSQDKYDLKLVPNAIAFNESDAWMDKTITPSAERTDLQGNRTNGLTINTSAVDGLRLYYSYVNTDGTLKKSALDLLTTSTFTLTETNAKTYIGIYFELRLYSGSSYRMCDYETVEIAKSENGAEGPGGAVATVTPGELSVQCDKDGKVATAISSQALSFVLTVGGVECTNVKATRPTSGVTPLLPALPNGVSVSSSGGTIVSISVAKQYAPAAGQTAPVTDTMLAAGATFLVKGTDAAGNEVTSRCTLGLKGLRQGEQGNNAVTYDFEFPEYSLSFDVQTMKLSGKVKLCVYKHDGSTTEFYTSTAPQISFDGGTTWDSMTKSAPYYTKDYSAGLSRNSQPATANFRVVIDSKTYATAMPITVKGDKGDLGKMCYIAGEYSDDIVYTSNSSQTVAVTVKSQSGNTEEVYVLVASTNVNSSGQHIAPTDASQSVWEKGQNNYNLIRTTYLFSEFAKLGSGVVSGDWLFSANGTIDGTAYNDGATYGETGKPGYMFFDPGLLTGSRIIISSDRRVTTGNIATISLTAGSNKIIRIECLGTTSMTVALKKGSTTIKSLSITNQGYETKDIVINDTIAEGDYTLAVTSGSGYVRQVKIVSFAPKFAVDLLTGETYQRNAYVEGEIVIKNSSGDGVVRINNGTASKETTETGVTILDAAGLYSRVSSGEGFRLDADNGLQRYNNRGSGEWVPFFAKRRVRVLTGNNPTLDKYDDMVILTGTTASVTLPANPTNGDVITIRLLAASSAYLRLGSSSHFLYTDQKYNYEAINTNKRYGITQNHRYEFVFWDNIWYLNRIEV